LISWQANNFFTNLIATFGAVPWPGGGRRYHVAVFPPYGTSVRNGGQQVSEQSDDTASSNGGLGQQFPL
jgi:hypothetical protein